ncbi:MAG: hypothetical protein ACRETK_06190 [Steroidobacteraceae bacterium]
MERETLLAMLIMLLGGLALQLLAAWPLGRAHAPSAPEHERRCWLTLWYPMAPMLVVVAWLCGWALVEPDPVRDPLDPAVVVLLWLPFGLLFGRAAARAGWSLLRRPRECGVSTVGLLQPQTVFSPFLAKQLEDGVISAALAHERAHALHRDPLRIWLAQLVTDLQWPWPAAQRRLGAWLEALELARDQEARACGIDGAELAAAVLASVRFLKSIPPEERAALSGTQVAHARLIGDSRTLKERVLRLLAPVPAGVDGDSDSHLGGFALIFGGVLAAALVLGMAYGERITHLLLGLTIW